VEDDLIAAKTAFRSLGYPIWVARTQLDRADWLARQDRLDESARLAAEAAASFENVGAVPMLARARGLFEAQVSGSFSGSEPQTSS
jgi:hypothetical protein